MKEGLTWLWHQQLIFFTALVMGGLIVSSIGYTLIVIVLAQSQHASSFTIGIIFASGGAGSVVGALLASSIQRRYRIRSKKLETMGWKKENDETLKQPCPGGRSTCRTNKTASVAGYHHKEGHGDL